LNGQKIFNSGADLKDNYLTVAARTDKEAPRHKGITVFLVHNESPGVTIKRLDFPARRIVSLNEVYYDEVKIPKDMVVGEVNRGWEVVVSQLEMERINGAAGYVGTSQTAVEDAMEYAKQRVQFGRPIAKFQVIKHMLVDMQTEVDAARLLVYRVAFLVRDGIRCAKEASMAKLYASEVFQRVTANGIQIMGAYGLVGDSDMLRYFLEARPSTIGGGTSQIQREIIAEQMGL
jgi:alkylation response protein AidB-like acyl-CoA dehydrogenase